MGEGLRPHWHIPYCEKIVEYDDHVVGCHVRKDVYAILNPKKETSKEAKKEYLNLFATSGNRTVYNTKYVKVGTINPKKYNGLSYEVIEYSKDKRYTKIKTAYYGTVLICIDTKKVGKEFSITTTKKYK